MLCSIAEKVAISVFVVGGGVVVAVLCYKKADI